MSGDVGNVKIISASAGSGKTYTLAYEYVKSVVADPRLYRHILAVTFTNKATEEMKSRILERIHELASGGDSPYLENMERELGLSEHKIRANAAEAQKNILHDYSRFAVLTIDRFFQRLIRSFLRELGVDINFNLELETETLLSQAADALIDDAARSETLLGGLFAAARDRIDEGKRWSVKEPLLGLGKELFGEQYARSRRTAIPVEQTQTLIDQVITRGDRARKEIIEKARQALAAIGAAGLGVEDFRGKTGGVVPYLTRIASGEIKPPNRYVREIVESGDGRVPQLSELLAELVDVSESNAQVMNSAQLLRENHRNFLLLTDLQQRIEQICNEQNIMPIAQTGRLISRLVGGSDAPFVFEKVGNYFAHFFIDEFQDTSTMQWENFVPLLKNAISEEQGTPVMLIGDVKQAIYRWRGGDWRILSQHVRREMGADRVEFEALDTNYRSARRVVEFNNRAMELLTRAANNELQNIVDEGVTKKAITHKEADELSSMIGEAYSGCEQKPSSDIDQGYITFTQFKADGDGKFVPPVVERIEEVLSRGYSAGDIAVLVRSNTQAVEVAQMLLARNFPIVTQDALMVGSAAVSRFIVACFTLAVDPANDIARATVNRWTGRGFGEKLSEGDAEFFARIAGFSPEEAFEEIVMRFNTGQKAAEVAYVQALHQQITTFSARSVGDIQLFLKWWHERGFRASITMQGRADAITVSTIHKAKGLEYKVVVVPWLSWSLSPGQGIVWARTAEDPLDEAGALPITYKKEMSESFFAPMYYREQALAHIDALNMFYVAATRAREELHLMNSSSPRDRKNSVGNILCNALGVSELMTWGSPCKGVKSAERLDDTTLVSYPTSRPNVKLRLGKPSASREFGVAMHGMFECATDADILQKYGDNQLVREWFTPENWDEVRRENDILAPGDGSTKRPDRVMIRGGRAVVVDYKFGEKTSTAYVRQLHNYARLIEKMGYSPVEGYVWYVALNKIEKV